MRDAGLLPRGSTLSQIAYEEIHEKYSVQNIAYIFFGGVAQK